MCNPSRLLKHLCLVVVVFSAIFSLAGDFRQKGYFEAYLHGFPQVVPNDQGLVVTDALFRYEPSYTTKSGLSFFASLETEIDSHHQVDRQFDFSWFDRTGQRQISSVRRFSAVYRKGSLTMELGKQFVHWGKTDILVPTDRLSPKDYLNEVDTDTLAVTAARFTIEKKANTVDLVFVPRFTPSRTPLLNQRWFVVPTSAQNVSIQDGGAKFPGGPEFGFRWGRIDKDIEYSVSYFDGYNNLPVFNTTIVSLLPAKVDLVRAFPRLRAFGGDLVIPTRWFTIKTEAEDLTSSTANADEYVLFVVQLERQWKEWLFIGGYAGDDITRRGAAFEFAADRGLARSFVGRAQLTIDTNRSLVFEGVIRQNGDGYYGKAEYSQAFGQHWRATLALIGIGGAPTDFLGQYSKNSYGSLAVRYSF